MLDVFNVWSFKTILEYKKWVIEMENLIDPIFYAIIDRQTLKAIGVISYLRIDIKIFNRSWSFNFLKFT